MKNTLFLALISILFFSCSQNKMTYVDEIKNHQYELNTFYSDKEESPLTEEDFKTFKSLDFFEIDKTYRVKATFLLTPDSPIFEMPTTTARLPLYRKYGVATFSLNGKDFQLSLYQHQKEITSTDHSNLLFLPFNDLSNGKTSYGGGRFIDIETPTANAKTVIIDFNKSYNPYCAYNSKYSCPIPPKENSLAIEIPVGVKSYGEHH